MHAIGLLHKRLRQSGIGVHAKRLEVLFVAVSTLFNGRWLMVTDMGRGVISTAYTKHNIKRMDRLLSNGFLFQERRDIYAMLSRGIVGKMSRPIILVDWSDLTADGKWHLLRATLAVGGRGLTLWEEVHPQKHYGRASVQKGFLKTLKVLLPEGARPIILTDAGFRGPWFKAVQALGWDWIGRVRNRTYVKGEAWSKWAPCKDLYAKASTLPKALGVFEQVRSAPLKCALYLVRKKKQRRVKKTLMGNRARSKHSKNNARRETEPWLLASSLSLAAMPAKTIVKLYATRMQIEENFRDSKDPYYGFGFSRNRTKDPKRLAILLLIGAIATLAAWLAGRAAEKQNLQYRYQSNTTKRRRVLSSVFLGRWVIRDQLLCFTKMQLLAPLQDIQTYNEELLCE